MDDAFSIITIDRSTTPHKVTVDMRSAYNRPTAKGEINEQNERLHTGYVNFPDDRKYRFWYHTDEAKIYWDNDKGRTRNIWTGRKKYKGTSV